MLVRKQVVKHQLHLNIQHSQQGNFSPTPSESLEISQNQQSEAKHSATQTSFHAHLAVCQNLVPLVNIKIAGKWMFMPLKMVLIGIDPYPFDIVDTFWHCWHFRLFYWCERRAKAPAPPTPTTAGHRTSIKVDVRRLWPKQSIPVGHIGSFWIFWDPKFFLGLQ